MSSIIAAVVFAVVTASPSAGGTVPTEALPDPQLLQPRQGWAPPTVGKGVQLHEGLLCGCGRLSQLQLARGKGIGWDKGWTGAKKHVHEGRLRWSQ